MADDDIQALPAIRRCAHQVTLETDHLRCFEVIRCMRCGQRVEIPFMLLANATEDTFAVIAQIVRQAFDIAVTPPSAWYSDTLLRRREPDAQ